MKIFMSDVGYREVSHEVSESEDLCGTLVFHYEGRRRTNMGEVIKKQDPRLLAEY